MMSSGYRNQSPLSESIGSVDLTFNGDVFLTIRGEVTDSMTATAFDRRTSGKRAYEQLLKICLRDSLLNHKE